MNFLRALLDFYINASIHVALAVLAFVKVTLLYLNLEPEQNLELFIFFATITGYNFVKYAGVARLHHMSLTKNLRIIQIFSLFSFIALCWFAYKLPLRTLWFFAPFGVLTILYAVPFLSGFQKNLRSVAHLKVLVIGVVWTAVTVLLPVYHGESTLNTQVILLAVQRFLIVVVLILPFDIRDMRYDKISMQTIPQKIGVPQTKRFGLLLLLISLALEFMLAPTTVFKNVFMIFLFMSLLLLMRSKEAQNKYYSALFVEALPIFWWVLLLVSN